MVWILALVDWSDLISKLILGLIGAMSAWTVWRSQKTAGTVDKVHTLTNSAMGIQKKSLAEVTAAKAAITHDPTDIEAARVALLDYTDHITKQSAVDSTK
jgi:hypothetical protein